MPNLVRAVIGDQEVNVSPEYAESNELEVLDEPTHIGRRQRPQTRANSRPMKPKTTVADAAAKKAAKSADTSNPPSKES